MLTVREGRLIVYRLFDVSTGIDLDAVERMAREGTRRLRVTRSTYMKAIEFADPPVSFELRPFTATLFGHESEVSVVARLYDFGVLTISFEIPLPVATPMKDVERVVRELDSDPSLDERARGYASEVAGDLGDAAIEPRVKEGFVEDYMVVFIRELGDGATAAELASAYDASRLLLYEEGELSEQTKKETLRHSYSYYPGDLVIVHTDSALVVEPSGSPDIPDILEFAKAQMLELRYYDSVLDHELEWIYGELSKKRPPSFFRLREYERLTRRLTRTVTDMTDVTERVNNSLKVTEDLYYARVYRAAMTLLRSSDWESSVREKLGIAMDTYRMLHDDISNKRGYVVEVGIFLLIVIDIALVLLEG